MTNTSGGDIKGPGLVIAQPTEGDGYLIVARDLVKGAAALSTFADIPPRACALIAAHALECILKAYLWNRESRIELRDSSTRHNILALWDLAFNECSFGISEKPPAWVRALSAGHGPDFYFRYQMGKQGIIVHGGQTPDLQLMVAELRSLLKTVEKELEAL